MACSYYKNFGKTDENEKRLLSWYPDEDPLTIAIDLDSWRNIEQKGIDEFPKSKRSFTYFRNHRINDDKTPSKYDVSDAQYKSWEKAVYELWSPAVRKTRLHMLAEMFSSRIDKFQEEKRKEHKYLSRAKCLTAMGGTRTVLKSIVDDLAGKSLDDIVRGNTNLFNGASSFEELTDSKLKSKAKYIQKQYELMQKYFPGIDLLSRTIINKYETGVNVKTFVNEDDYTEDEKGAVTDLKGKRYSDHSEADIESSLTARAKLILRDLYETTKDNTPKYDDLGYLVRVDPDAAFKILVSTCWVSTSESFINDIRSQASTYRWMGTLADRLEQRPNDSKEVAYQRFNDAAALWASAKKAKNTYIYMKLNNKSGHYNRSIINTRAADNALLKEMNVNFGKIVLDSKHPVYNEDGAIINTEENAKKLRNEFFHETRGTRASRINTSVKDTYFEPEKNDRGEFISPRVRKMEVDGNIVNVAPGINAMSWYLDNYADEVEMVADVARGMGIDIVAEDIKRAALKPIDKKDSKYFHLKSSKKALNRYEIIANIIFDLNGTFTNKKKYEEVSPHIADTLDDLFKALNPGVYNQVASKGMDEDKIRQTYTTPNLLSEVMLTLRNERDADDEEFADKIQNEYLNFEGFTLKEFVDGELKDMPTGFLRYILNNETAGVEAKTITTVTDRAKQFSVLNLSSFNHSLYEEMKKQQVATAQFSLFRGNNRHEDPAFILPVVSDYTTCYVYKVPEAALPTIKDNWNSGSSSHLLVDSSRQNKFGETGIFNYNAPIVRALADEVLIEYNRIQAIEDRVAYRKTHPDSGSVELNSYEKNGLNFQIFPEMNSRTFDDMTFRQKFESVRSSKGESEAMDYLKYTVAKLLYDNMRADWQKFEETGAFKGPEFRYDLETRPDGTVDPDKGIKNPEFLAEFELFSAQTFYVRQQATKLFLNDTAQFDNMLEFEKRAMMLHAPGIQVYAKDGVQTVLYLPDLVEASVYKDKLDKLFDVLVKKKLMSQEQADINKEAYKAIKTTDGQGFRTLPSYRRICRGLGEWTDEQEYAYREVMNGRMTPEILSELNIGPKKLRYSGYQAIEATRTNTGVEQKDIKLDVLHKYSEQVLLPFHKFAQSNNIIAEMSNSPLVGLSSAIYRMWEEAGLDDDYNDRQGNRNLDVPELILFKSGCKVGYHDGVEGLWEPEGDKPLSIATIAGRVRAAIENNPNAVQALDIVGLGKAATIDADTENTRIHIASQAEKMIWGNINPNDVVHLADLGNIKATRARRIYDEISTAITVKMWQQLCDDLGNASRARKVLMEEMDKMPYVSEETKMALSRVESFHGNIPLFAPQIQKDAQSILLSVVRKRMTKHKAPGTRFAQRTSLGWDVSNVEFQGLKGVDSDDKLRIKFNKDGSIKYVEAYVPLINDKFAVFADNKGEISAKRLRELEEDGVIPEEALYAVSYRTPSDAEHSAIPIKIKGFISPLSGRGIILPHEIMVMTGHDYDGDELPTHFKTIDLEIDEEKVRKHFNELLSNEKLKGLEFTPKQLKSLAEGNVDEVFEDYLKHIKKSDKAANSWAYKITVPKYDYTKDAYYTDEEGNAVIQDMAAMDNARIDLLFAQMTSLSGSAKMIIPGGFEETKRIIKTIELLRTARTNESLVKVICDHYAIPITHDWGELFMYVRGMAAAKGKKAEALSSFTLDKWVDEYKVKESPFSAHHGIDSFGYMIETAELIGMFAMNLSSFQMLQKSKATYASFTRLKEDGTEETIDTTLFGTRFDNRRLFKINDVTGKNMLSRVLSRLINAAVDNGKDPILGFTNICKETVPLIALMCGLGMTEDQINIVINQPAVTMALNKVALDRYTNLSSALWEVISELQGSESTYTAETGEIVHRTENGKNPNVMGYGKAHEFIKDKSEQDFVKEMLKTPNEIRGELDHQFQISVLYTLRQMMGAAEDLNTFITSTVRADSSSGSVANSVGNTQNKIENYKECRARILNGSFRIGGLKDMVKEIEIDPSADPVEVFHEILESPVPQYTALNYLELETSMYLTKNWMPQARDSWRKLCTRIVKMYGYRRAPKGLRDKIYKEMLTWQILKDPAYGSFPGASSAIEGFAKLQDYMLAEVPAHVKNIKTAISRNKEKRLKKEAAEKFLKNRERNEKRNGRPYPAPIVQKFEADAQLQYDKDLAALENNIFLSMLSVYHEKDSRMKPRLQLHTGGIDVTKQADNIRAAWLELFSKRYNTEDNHELADLAADLVDYSMFVNGFGFGKYEFSHFASQKVLELAHRGRQLRAMRDVAEIDFDNEDENETFITFYKMNHHNDSRLVPRVSAYKLSPELAQWFGVESNPVNPISLEVGKMYLVQMGANTEPGLVRYNGPGAEAMFTAYSKLGTSNKYGQTSVEYNPYIDHPEQYNAYQLGDDTSWGDFSQIDFNAQMRAVESNANYESYDGNFDPDSLGELKTENGRIVRVKSGFADESSPAPTASVRDSLNDRFAHMIKASEAIKANEEALKAEAAGGFSQSELAYEPIDIENAGGDYSDLSNFAIRPFDHTWANGKTMHMKSVEQAFQIAMASYAKDAESVRLLQRNTSGASLRRLGRMVKDLDVEGWNNHRDKFMETFMRESFQQNPEALQRLLATGNRPLTSEKERDEHWRTKFPELLMKLRAEFGSTVYAEPSSSEYLKEHTAVKPGSLIHKHTGNWTRKEAEEHPEILYVFTDNTDRDSGSGVIPGDSWYSKKYGKGHHYPTQTAAVLRGLENAMPISTQRWYHRGATGILGRWQDKDVEEFTAVVREELEAINTEFRSSGKYQAIMFPQGDGLFNSNISNISKERTPVLYNVLNSLLIEYGLGDIALERPSETSEAPQNEYSEQVRYAPIAPAKESIRNAEDNKAKRVQVSSAAELASLVKRVKSGDQEAIAEMKKLGYLSITRIDKENGKAVIDKVPATPGNLELARRQEAYVKLNELLIPILKKAGVGVGKLSAEEILAMANEGMAMHGVTDFETTKVFANGLRELIRIEEGYEGQAALPEEFAHVAIAMLGDENPLVVRLYNALRSNEAAMREAFDGEYDAYKYLYEKEGGDWQNKMVIEAAGKLVAKQLLRSQEVKNTGVKGLIRRVVDAIKNLFRKITSKSVENAIFESEKIASKLGRDLLSGRLLDEMKFDNIGRAERFLNAKKDISHTKNILEKLIAIEIKRENIFDRRLGHDPKARGKSQSYVAVVNQLHQLRMNLKRDKTELAVVTYMNNTLDFLRNAELNLDNAINSGMGANRVTGLLNLLRDTLISNIQALDIIKQAIDEGEITDSGNLVSTYNEISNVISDFYRKYKGLSLTYFERMLADVFGKDGITLTIGPNKGKHISIHELATIGVDSSMIGGTMSRLFNSMADQDDMVLQAFDSIVRSAKNRARAKQQEIASRIVAAFSALESATGSKDQTFMFEYKDGKKTGKYISSEESNKLSQAQKKFYDEMTAIKSELDKLIPKSRVKDRGIIMIQKSRIDRIGAAEGIAGKIQAIKDTRREKIDSYLVDDEETAKTVYVDFEGNKVDMLPIKYTSRGNRSYDSMTDDVASSMMAYAGMATEYNEMHSVINILENAKYASMERDMIQKRGGRQLQEHAEYADTELTKPFTVKQARTSAQKCLDDFMTMHVYGHLRAAEGVTPIFHLPKAMLADIISAGTTYTQMAFNFQQRISNVTTGAAQIFVNTAGKDEFSIADMTWASGQWMKETADRLAEFGKEESHNYLSLFMQKFDIGQKLNDASKKKTFGKSRASKIFNTNLMFAGLELGEDYLSATTGLAVARNTKLKLDGKEINLYEAYEIAYADEANKIGAYLKLKDGVTKLDGSEFSSTDELNFSKKVAGINFRLQGIYNTDDKAAIQQYSLGALIIMYRKWIAPSLKRRYGAARYNELTGKEEEGYYRTSLRFVGDIVKTMVQEGESLKASIMLNWNNLTDYEKANCQKAITEFGIIVGIIGGLAAIDLLPPDGEDDEKTLTWRDNMVVYQLLRLKNEMGAMAPTPMLVQEATKILSSPMASIRVLDNALKGINLLNPMNYETFAGDDAVVKSGRFKGHSKAYKYFWSLPILSIRKSIENAVDPEPLINFYKN